MKESKNQLLIIFDLLCQPRFLIYVRFLLPLLLLTLGRQLKAGPQETAEKVLHDIYVITGNLSAPQPSIIITADPKVILQYRPQGARIEMNIRLFALCLEFGKDSLDVLAYFLGHELTHHFQTQKNLYSTGTNFLAYGLDQPRLFRQEKVADLQGAFMAYMANYDSWKVMPKAIEKLYEHFQLNDSLSGYPSLEERKHTVAEISSTVDTLIQVFEISNYLMAAGNYKLAKNCLEYISKYYSGREILNNLGVLHCQLALINFGRNYDPFIYPFEIDPLTRLNRTRAEPLTQQEIEERNLLVEKAITYFDQAHELDTQYEPAYINKFCALVLSEKYSSADSFARQIPHSVAVKSTFKPHYQLASGVLAAKRGQNQEALQVFQNLSLSDQSAIRNLARINLHYLQNKTYLTYEGEPSPIKLKKLPFLPYLYSDCAPVFLAEGFNMRVKFYIENQYTVATICDGFSIFFAQILKDIQVRIHSDLGIGSMIDEAVHLLGSHYFVNVSAVGSFYFFKEHHLLVKVDLRNRIEEFCWIH